MSQVVYRGNLSVKQFPFLTDYYGRSVIVAGNDNNFSRPLTSGEDADKDIGIPLVYYCHNVLPTSFGFQTVGYDLTIPSISSLANPFTSAELLRSNALSSSIDGPRFYFAPNVSGIHYTYALGSTGWAAISNSVPILSTTITSYATVQGISYIFFSGIGCYKWNSTSNTLIPVTLTALLSSDISGITAYQGYMVAWDLNNIYWSSVLDIDPTTNTVDFTPSLISGAGNIRPEGARGPISIVLPATFGLAIYTVANIVSAVYSGNSRYPFNFKEVINSGGCSSRDLVGYDANTGNQYAYTTSGLQIVTATATQTIFPEVTDFLAGEKFEDFDEPTLTFSSQTLTSPMKKKVTNISDRYLVMSYGISSLTHAIVYDMTQKRFGKLKINHVSCFEYQYLDPTLADAPRRSIAFLGADGSTYILNPSVTAANSYGVIMLGKFQYARSRQLTMEQFIMQNSEGKQRVTAHLWSSPSGGTIASATRSQMYDMTANNETQKIYNSHKTAWNHSVMLVGGFTLNSFVLTFHIAGRR